ncbi:MULTISPECIES: ABC transporter ATP-binding protein [Lachnospiraceae]|uniref:ABC-type quaternary amine transporter n=1 Tax=Coprococcus comes TaxID=410072 RepID=A0A3R6AWY2_9FIRM|nr:MULTISPECIES: ABC transporter ATP-binding protein [Coprococcus]RGU43851.1 ABC transporter ATP-binding protein [Coprococcus comes]
MYLELKNISKSFGEKEVVKDLSLSLPKGELLCLLGASGCGKTTTLKMISGFLKTDKGQILVDGQDITTLAPEKRPVSTVFQSYALFPHMSVLENVIYGLKFRGIRKKEAREMGMEYLKIVDMEEYAGSSIGEISGGQQQRVALVRSLITKPKVLLLDEPLSNLDAKLRVKMREEIREIQKKYEITMVFVTHDQEEAMVLGDQIAIMDQGKLVQIGKPEEVYLHPQNDFARDFLGISNRFADIHGNTICCRPEELEFAAEGSVKGIVRQEEFLGFYRQYYVETMNHEHIIVRTDRNIKVEEGKEVQLRVK